MKAEIKEAWIKALRSGKYKQGFHNLRAENSISGDSCFCVLGVLCDVVLNERSDHPRIKWERSDYDWKQSFYYDGMKSRTYPPHWLLIDVDLDDRVSTHLAQLNDRDRLNFKDLAEYIEKYL